MARPPGYLTRRQKAFAEALPTAASATEAARIAGYRPTSAIKNTASENLAKPVVMAAAKAAAAKHQAKLDLSREKLAAEYSRSALGDPTDALTWRDKHIGLAGLVRLLHYADQSQQPPPPIVNVTLVLGEKQLLITSPASETAAKALGSGQQ